MPEQRAPDAAPVFLSRPLAGAAWCALAFSLGAYVSYRIYSHVGEPAVPLDDSYIHFNYARSFARLEPFVYADGAPPTTGATSLLWVLALSTFWLVGFRELSLIWAAWALGWLCLGLLAWETSKLAARLVRPPIALTAGLMVLCFSPHTWFASSGMEVLPLAWLLMLTARLCVDFAYGKPLASTDTPTGTATAAAVQQHAQRVWPLLASSFCAAITRPEGVIAAAMAAFTLLFFGGWGKRRFAAVALVGPLVSPLLNLAVTGDALSATAQAKLLSTSPYATPGSAWEAQLANLKLFFQTLLNGEQWADGMIPTGVWWLPLTCLLAVVVVGRRQRLAALLVLAIALGALLPTAYWTFLVNRLRYLWPFAAAWLIGVAALCELIARGIDWGVRRARLKRGRRLGSGVGAALGVAAALVLADELPAGISDLVTSSSGIHRQQVSLARWAKAELPQGAAIGVNDAGAIAYLSGHPTVDLVGLTTRGQARYWRAGPGPRFEHYEHSLTLPPYLILYPSWLNVDAITGAELARRSVYGATILGSPEMVAFETRYDLLRTAEAPPAAGKLVDRLDVCELESEAAHAYHVFMAHEGTSDVRIHQGRADGARTFRSQERFELELAPGGVLWMRGGADWPVSLSVQISGEAVGDLELTGLAWEEVSLKLPASLRPGRHQIELRPRSQVWFATAHFWSLE